MTTSKSNRQITDKEQKKILIEILAYIDSVCRKYHIKYSLVGGSMIGAVRHHGIIPWDDDVDIVFTPENYQKFIDTIQAHPDERYRLLTHEIEPTYFYPYAKIVDSYTTLDEYEFQPINNYGVYVDVFCYHRVPNDENLRRKQFDQLKRTIGMLVVKMRKNQDNSYTKNPLKILKNYYIRMLSVEQILKRYQEIVSRYNDLEDAKFYCVNWPAYSYINEIVPITDYAKYHDTDFDGITVMLADGYDHVLTTTYGDYMQLPPKEKRIPHHTFTAEYKKSK